MVKSADILILLKLITGISEVLKLISLSSKRNNIKFDIRKMDYSILQKIKT